MSTISNPIIFPNPESPWTAGITNRLEWNWTNISNKSSGPNVTENTPLYNGTSFSVFFHTTPGSAGGSATYDLPDQQGESGSVGVDIPKEVLAGNYSIEFNLHSQYRDQYTFAFNKPFQILSSVGDTVDAESEDDSSSRLSPISSAIFIGFVALSFVATVV